MKVSFTPHLGHCFTPFVYIVKDRKQASLLGLFLSLYQSFLGENNHSQPIKARLEFKDDSNKVLPNSNEMVNDVNTSPLFDLPSFDDFEQYAKKRNMLLLSVCPQIPCKSFDFPVKEVIDVAMLMDAISKYDAYLLDECSKMRVEYSSSSTLSKLNRNATSEDDVWIDWYYENSETDTYFENIDDYIEFLTQ